MFPETIDFVSSHDHNGMDHHQTREIDRYISANKKKNLVLHSLLHNRCKFCVNSFSTGCRNCCLPICQEFKNVNAKKLLKNTAHNISSGNNNRAYLKRSHKSVGQLGLYPSETLLETPHSVSPRFSPSLSARNLVVASRASSHNSTGGTSPVPPADNEVADDLPFDKMSLVELSRQTVPQDCESRFDLPSAPSPGLVLFNNEEQSDIVFLVGKDHSKLWRFPAHSFILEEASSFFKAITNWQSEHGKAANNEIRINWCDPGTFHAILKYIYTNEVTIKSVAAAMTLFNASNSFYLFHLSKLCLTFLCDHCNLDNVLEVLAYFHGYLKHLYSIKTESKDYKGCQSSIDNNDLLGELNRLIVRCYSVVDFNADAIIISEEFGNLNHELVENILCRDTLNVTVELTVYTAINQWACQQCKKQCKELTDVNKRQVLGELVYCPRYLTMSLDDFIKGPYTSEILDNQEKQLLLDKIKGNCPTTPLPGHMLEFKIDVERHYEEIDLEEEDDEPEEDTESTSEDLSPEMVESNNMKKSGDVTTTSSKRNKANKKKKKPKSRSKRILHGIGELLLCVIKLLD